MAKRGRPVGSKTKNKSESAAPPAVGSKPGHNALTDEEQKALHERHVSEYEVALKEKKEIDASFKNVCKRIKAEGGSVASVKRTIELRTPEGEAALKAEMAELAKIARWSGVGIQLDLLTVSEPTSIERAKDLARRDANSGHPAKTDYAPGTPEYDAYMEAWHDAHSKRNATLAAAVNGDAGEAAAEAFDDSVPDAEPKPYSQQLREENKDIEQSLRAKSEEMQAADDKKDFPEIPANMKREAETV